jgi:hypothetical protein
MGEYGRIVGETSGAAGGSGGGGSKDFGGDIMSALSDAVDQIAELPTEVLLLFIGIVLIGGLVITLRPS